MKYATEELLNRRQDTCEVCGSEGIRCDTPEGEIVRDTVPYLVPDEATVLCHDADGQVTCATCTTGEQR